MEEQMNTVSAVAVVAAVGIAVAVALQAPVSSMDASVGRLAAAFAVPHPADGSEIVSTAGPSAVQDMTDEQMAAAEAYWRSL
jgi:hypothetical protein